MQTNRLISLYLSAVIMLGFTSYATGLKAYQKGNYYKASTQAVERLRKKPTNEKATIALRESYPRVIENALRDIEINKVYDNVYALDENIRIYEELNRLAYAIRHCPAALRIIPNPQEFYEEMKGTMDAVAEISYEEGLKALSYNTLEQSRLAYSHFLKVQEYSPGYKDVIRKLEESRYKATLRVIVSKPVTNPAYTLSADFFYNKLMEEISVRNFKNLVRFYTPQEATTLGMDDPHEVLVLNFENFTVGNVLEKSNTYEVKRDSVIVGTTKVNGVDRNVYGTVNAKVTIERIEITSGGVLSVRMLDPFTNKVLRQRNFSGSSVWFREWGSFNGDERALSKEEKDIVNSKRPAGLPTEQQLFVSFAEKPYIDASKYISSLY